MRATLKRLRADEGISVNRMAAMLGISAWHYYKIEQGIRNPSIGLAKQIADVLGESVDILFFAQDLDTASRQTTANG